MYRESVIFINHTDIHILWSINVIYLEFTNSPCKHFRFRNPRQYWRVENKFIKVLSFQLRSFYVDWITILSHVPINISWIFTTAFSQKNNSLGLKDFISNFLFNSFHTESPAILQYRVSIKSLCNFKNLLQRQLARYRRQICFMYSVVIKVSITLHFRYPVDE